MSTAQPMNLFRTVITQDSQEITQEILVSHQSLGHRERRELNQRWREVARERHWEMRTVGKFNTDFRHFLNDRECVEPLMRQLGLILMEYSPAFTLEAREWNEAARVFGEAIQLPECHGPQARLWLARFADRHGVELSINDPSQSKGAHGENFDFIHYQMVLDHGENRLARMQEVARCLAREANPEFFVSARQKKPPQVMSTKTVIAQLSSQELLEARLREEAGETGQTRRRGARP